MLILNTKLGDQMAYTLCYCCCCCSFFGDVSATRDKYLKVKSATKYLTNNKDKKFNEKCVKFYGA